MNIKDCIDFASANPFCFLATVDGNQPHVRTVMMVFADETGFYFETFPGKNMSNQLHANPKVELCFYNNATDMMQARHLRITGEVEFTNNPDILDRVYEVVKVLEPLAGGPFKEMLEVYHLSHGEAHFWTMTDLGKEDKIEHLVF